MSGLPTAAESKAEKVQTGSGASRTTGSGDTGCRTRRAIQAGHGTPAAGCLAESIRNGRFAANRNLAGGSGKCRVGNRLVNGNEPRFGSVDHRTHRVARRVNHYRQSEVGKHRFSTRLRSFRSDARLASRVKTSGHRLVPQMRCYFRLGSTCRGRACRALREVPKVDFRFVNPQPHYQNMKIPLIVQWGEVVGLIMFFANFCIVHLQFSFYERTFNVSFGLPRSGW